MPSLLLLSPGCNSPLRVDRVSFRSGCLVAPRSWAPLLSREIKLPKLHPRGARCRQVENLRDGHLLFPSSPRRQARAGCLAPSFYRQSESALGPTRLRFRYLALACVIFLALPAHRLLSISSLGAGLILLKFRPGARHVKSHLDDPWLCLVISGNRSLRIGS